MSWIKLEAYQVSKQNSFHFTASHLFFFLSSIIRVNITTLNLWALRVISIKFLLVILVNCKTEWSWELRTWSHNMILLDILSTSPNFFCRKWIGTTNENSNLDLRVLGVLEKKRKGSWTRLSFLHCAAKVDHRLLFSKQDFRPKGDDDASSSSCNFVFKHVYRFLYIEVSFIILQRKC